MITIILFLLGIVFLVKGGGWFVDGAVEIAHKFKIPELIIGATIVSIGTTLPEVLVSAQAAFQGDAGISYGNAIGSIICNTSLISAILIAVTPSKVEKKPLVFPAITFFLAAIFYSFIASQDSFSRTAGVILLLMFAVYIIITIKNSPQTVEEHKTNTKYPWLFLLLGAVLIAFGAKLVVDNGTIIAELLGVPSSVIGLTVVALGTSLPEMTTAITSLVKGHNSLSIGNVIGANIFNLTLVSGTAITISPFDLPCEKLINGMNASLLVDIPVMFFVMFLLCIPVLAKGKTYRWQGITLLICYAGFCGYQFFF